MKNETRNERIKAYREYLKDSIRLATDFDTSDQNMGVATPAIEKEPAENARIFTLPTPDVWHETLGSMSVRTAMFQRKSWRKYSQEPLSLEELSYLLWVTQGVRRKKEHVTLRTVPSAGNRHALETYLSVFNVEGLEEGIYRYLPSRHQLVLEKQPENLRQKTAIAALDQPFAGKSAVTFIWTAIPYRMEWRYVEASVKVIAMDAGHVCQNLYLACESIGAGTCAIAAYHQQLADQLLQVDGEEEFVVYMAPVGKQVNKFNGLSS